MIKIMKKLFFYDFFKTKTIFNRQIIILIKIKHQFLTKNSLFFNFISFL